MENKIIFTHLLQLFNRVISDQKLIDNDKLKLSRYAIDYDVLFKKIAESS
jgi:hypothetical protein